VGKTRFSEWQAQCEDRTTPTSVGKTAHQFIKSQGVVWTTPTSVGKTQDETVVLVRKR